MSPGMPHAPADGAEQRKLPVSARVVSEIVVNDQYVRGLFPVKYSAMLVAA